MVQALRDSVNNSKNLALIWAPNSGNGYPFLRAPCCPIANTTDLRLMDTNNNGTVDGFDDPYTPYYPGDEWVDWVGFSVRHFLD